MQVSGGEQRAEFESKAVDSPAELRSYFTYDHETNRVSLRIQAAEMCVMMLHLHIKRSQLGWLSI